MSHKIVNNTVIANFASIHRLDMLKAVMGTLCLPAQVYEEILTGIAAGRAFQERARQEILRDDEHKWLKIVELHISELPLFAYLSTQLGKGEAACIAMAQSRGWSFLSDDKKARRIATEAGITISGTIGILRVGLVKGLYTLAEVDEVLRAMRAAGYYSPVQSMDELIRR